MLRRPISKLKFSTLPSVVADEKGRVEKSPKSENAEVDQKKPLKSEFVGWEHFRDFFDRKSNWGKPEVKTGRSWQASDLRKKSNSDLHKLWFVFLKERNALLTTQKEAKRLEIFFPGEERLYKVEESMENLEDIVAERNDAYCELEFGRTARRPKRRVTTPLGFHEERYLDESFSPTTARPPTQDRDHYGYELPMLDDQAAIFQKMYKEKLWLDKRDEEDDKKRELKQHKWIHRY